MGAAGRISLIIAEDDELQRVGLSAYFEEAHDIDVVGHAADSDAVIAAAAELRPSVILVSLRLPGIATFETCRNISAVSAQSRIITLGSSPVLAEEVGTSLMVASGHLPKSAARTDFLRIVRAAASGEILISAEVAPIALRFLSAFPGPVNLGSLTPREREMLELVAKGLNNTQIAAKTRISTHTVRKHVSSVLRKLNVSSRAELGIYAPMLSILRKDPHS